MTSNHHSDMSTEAQEIIDEYMNEIECRAAALEVTVDYYLEEFDL